MFCTHFFGENSLDPFTIRLGGHSQPHWAMKGREKKHTNNCPERFVLLAILLVTFLEMVKPLRDHFGKVKSRDLQGSGDKVCSRIESPGK